MSDWLHGFIGELRRRGLSIAPSEAIDAARAVLSLGPENRARFRVALAMTLAKDRRAAPIFDEVFDLYFRAPSRTRGEPGRGRSPRESDGQSEGQGESSGRSGSSHSGGTVPPSTSDGSPRADRQDRKKAPHPQARPMERREPGKERKPVARASASPARPAPARPGRPAPDATRRVLRTLPRDAVLRALATRSPERSKRAALPTSETPDAHGRVRLKGLLVADSEGSDAPAHDPRRRSFRDAIPTGEERSLAREVPRLLDELRLRRSRRSERAARGRAYLKRAIRENLATGGVPFRIPVRRAKRKRARVVLIVDVSWSVTRAAGLFLMMALELLRRDRRVRAFLFIDRPIDATELLWNWIRPSPARLVRPAARRLGEHARQGYAPGQVARAPAGSAGGPFRSRTGRPGRGIVPEGADRSFADLLEATPGLDPDAASDYGRAFYALRSGPLRNLASDTLLVVLGDGRTNRFDPLPWAFEELASRARRVVWLVPEPRGSWFTGDSALARYLASCDLAVEARDLDGLAYGVRRIAAGL